MQLHFESRAGDGTPIDPHPTVFVSVDEHSFHGSRTNLLRPAGMQVQIQGHAHVQAQVPAHRVLSTHIAREEHA